MFRLSLRSHPGQFFLLRLHRHDGGVSFQILDAATAVTVASAAAAAKVSGPVAAGNARRTGAAEPALHVEKLGLELRAQLLTLLLQAMFVGPEEIDIFGGDAELERTAATVAV